MKGRFRNDLIKLGVFTAVAVLITVSVIATLLDLKLGQPTTSYHAMFTDASGLESGDVVRIAGVEVGKINGVGVTRDNQAEVSFTVASSEHLTTTSTASIQFENLLGQRYLQINAGPAGGQPLHSGATIPESRTRPGLDLTAVFSGFQPLLAALNPAQVNELTGSIIAVLQGESGAVANLVGQTATLTSNLAQRQAVFNEVLDNLTPLLTAVNSKDSQLGQLIDGFDTLVTGLAGQRNQIGGAVSGLSNLATATSHLLDRVQPTLDQDIGGVRNVTHELLGNQGTIGNVINDLPAFLNSLDKVSDSGAYLAVYVCDLTVHFSGPISVKLSPTVPQSPGLSVPMGVIGNPADHSQGVHMKRFRERNLYLVAGISAAVLLLAAYIALNFSKLPLIGDEHTYRADFATAVGLSNGDVVTIAGVRVGDVTGMTLHGGVARVSFTVNGNHHLGQNSRVDIKILNPVGVEYLQVTPVGGGKLSGPIPVSRTTVPDTLVYDLNQLTSQTQQTNISQLVRSLKVITQTLAAGTPSETKAALDGIAQLSAVLDVRQGELGQVIAQADQLTSVLNSRDAQLVGILSQADLVLQVLSQRKAALDNLLATTSTIANQIDHLISTDRVQLDPLLANLQTVSAALAKDSTNLRDAIPLLASFNRYVANVTGSGPFADFVAPTLVLPDNLLAQCASPGKVISVELGCRP